MQTLENWEIEKIVEYARNPRKNDHAVDKIAAAIREFGFRVPVLAKSDGSLVDGHLRLKAAKKLGLKTVPVMLCDDMTEAQIKAFRISVNKVAEFAEWDNELLRLEFEELKEMDFDIELTGFSTDELDALAFDEIESADFGESQGGKASRQLDDEKYTTKIETPIYEMKGKKPDISEIYNTTKTSELHSKIKKANLPDDVRGFLMAAASRHTVFNYELIAEFYAHQDRDVQELMEDSALVIIDYNKAIENGYVKLTKALMQLSGESANVAE